jgi:uncharacterized protein YuzE
MKSRYDAESDILYLLIKEGHIKDTVEVSEDMFIEYDENDEPVGIELWGARKNVFGELLKYINKLTEFKGSKKSSYTKKMKPLVQ